MGLLILPQYSRNVSLPPGTPAFPFLIGAGDGTLFHFYFFDYSETEQLLYYTHASTFLTSTGLFHLAVFNTIFMSYFAVLSFGFIDGR